MEYYFSKTLETSFEEAIKLTTEALKAEGFGVITVINMHEKLKEKLNVDFKRYTILGACNPPFAYKALQAEDKIGTPVTLSQGNVPVTDIPVLVEKLMAIARFWLGNEFYTKEMATSVLENAK
jgi:hypothetical protein